MPRKKMAAVLALFLLVGALSACGQASGGGKQSAVANTPAELVFYSTSADSEDSFNQRFGDPLRKKFPNFTIKYIQKATGTTLPELMAAGTQFDIYFDSIGNYMDGLNYNFQFDMTDLIREHKVDLNRFEPSVIDAIKQISGGKIYGLPVFTNNMITYYNKDIFDRFGVPYPKDGMTWDEMLELARRLDRTDSGKNFYGLAVSQSHILRLNPFSAPFVDPKTEKAAIVSNENWRKLYQTVFIAPSQNEIYKQKITDLKNKLPYKDQFVKDRELAMLVYLSNYFATNESDLAAMNWDMVSMPTFKELPGVGSQSYPTYFSITSMSKNKEAAMEAIKYLISDEYQLDASKKGIMTVLKSDSVKKAIGQETKFKDKNWKSIFYLKFAPIAPKTIYDIDVEKAYTAKLGDIAKGAIDLNTGLRTAEEEANKAIEALKKK